MYHWKTKSNCRPATEQGFIHYFCLCKIDDGYVRRLCRCVTKDGWRALHEAVTSSGITLEGVAMKWNVPPRTLSRWEREFYERFDIKNISHKML